MRGQNKDLRSRQPLGQVRDIAQEANLLLKSSSATSRSALALSELLPAPAR